MNKKILSIASFVLVSLLLILPTNTYAGECFTWPVYLKDYQVKIKAAVYLRDGPCSEDNGTSARVEWQVIAGGESVTVIASNWGWIKVKRNNGAIWWIWGPGWVAENLTEDRFASNQYESAMGYGISDTHKEFAALFGNTTTSPTPTTSQTSTYALSQSMKDNLDKTLDIVFIKITEKTDSVQAAKTMYGSLITALEKVKVEKPALAEIIRYLVDHIRIEKNSL